MTALDDHALGIRDLEGRQGGIDGMNPLELLNRKSFKGRRIALLHRADEFGMTRDNLGIDVHAVANPIESLETDIGAGEKPLRVSVFERPAHRLIG